MSMVHMLTIFDNLIFRGPNSLSEQRPETGDGM